MGYLELGRGVGAALAPPPPPPGIYTPENCRKADGWLASAAEMDKIAASSRTIARRVRMYGSPTLDKEAARLEANASELEARAKQIRSLCDQASFMLLPPPPPPPEDPRYKPLFSAVAVPPNFPSYNVYVPPGAPQNPPRNPGQLYGLGEHALPWSKPRPPGYREGSFPVPARRNRPRTYDNRPPLLPVAQMTPWGWHMPAPGSAQENF